METWGRSNKLEKKKMEKKTGVLAIVQSSPTKAMWKLTQIWRISEAQMTFRWFLGFLRSYAAANDKPDKNMASFSPALIVFPH